MALEDYESRKLQPIMNLDARYKPHLHFPWANRLVPDPAGLDAVVALSEASADAGCKRFVPGIGAARPLRHRPRADLNSINGGGQCVSEPFNETGAAHAPLATGGILPAQHTLHP